MILAPASAGWAAFLGSEDEYALNALRLVPGVEAAWAEEGWWVRGPALSGPEARRLGGLPARARYERLADDRLRLPGAEVPCRRLPADAPWVPLPDLLAVRLPPVVARISPIKTLALRLVRGGEEAAPGALLIDLETWVEWTSPAAAVRLQPLRFAVCAMDVGTGIAGLARVLVLGQPLPPLPGTRLVDQAGILVPAGWTWRPAVHAATVRQTLGLRADEIALWPGEGLPVSILPAEALVPASRAAVRLTGEAMRAGLPKNEP